jgi:hypothetical protein
VISVDYSSTLGLVVFCQEAAGILYLFAREIILARREKAQEVADDGPFADDDAAAGPDSDSGEEDGDTEGLDDDTRFLFDVIERRNEGLVQNIDALDNGLIAVAVGLIAIALFGGDKWFVSEPTYRFAGYVLLGESALYALCGYLSIYFVKSGAQDVVRLNDFVVDFGFEPVEATNSAIRATANAGEVNVMVRRTKRIALLVATMTLAAAAALIVAARVFGTP